MGIEKLFNELAESKEPVSIILSHNSHSDGYTREMTWILRVKTGDQLHEEEISTYAFGVNSNYQGIFEGWAAIKKGLELACEYAKRFQNAGCEVTIDGESLEKKRQKLRGIDKEYKERLKYF